MIFIIDNCKFSHRLKWLSVYSTEFLSIDAAKRHCLKNKSHTTGEPRYIVIPNSCVKRIFGNDMWSGMKAFDKNGTISCSKWNSHT
jgi:hypothetical protein